MSAPRRHLGVAIDSTQAISAVIPVVVLALVLAALAQVTDWEGPALEAVGLSGSGSQRLLFSSIFVAICFLALLLFVSSRSDDRSPQPEWVMEFRRLWIIPSLRLSMAVPIVLGLGAIFAAPAAIDGIVSPWLWAGSVTTLLALTVAALSRGRDVDSEEEEEVRSEGTTEDQPDVMAWWTSFIESPYYHGQKRELRTLPSRQELDEAAFAPPNIDGIEDFMAIFESLVESGRSVRRYVRSAFTVLRKDDPDGEQPLCVLDVPNGAGLSTLAAALGIYYRSELSRRTLIIAPSDSRSDSLARRIRGMVDSSPTWNGSLIVGGVTSQEDLAAAGASYATLPDVLIVDPVGLDLLLRRGMRGAWSHFFSTLGLVTVVGAYGLSGTPGAHVAMLLRRLNILWKRLGASPAFLVDCIAATEQLQFLEDLLGRPKGIPANCIVSEEDLPRHDVEIVGWIPSLRVLFSDSRATPSPIDIQRRSFLDDVEALASDAVNHGLRVLVVRRDQAMSSSDLASLRNLIERRTVGVRADAFEVVTGADENQRGISHYDVLIYAGFPDSWAELEYQCELLGSERAPGTKLAILVAPHEPRALNFIRQQMNVSPGHSLEIEQPMLRSLHLRAAINSGPLRTSELRALGDVEPQLQQWLSAGVITEEPGATRRLGAVARASSSDEFEARMDLESTDEAVARIVSAGSRQQELARIDVGRAFQAAYPGALIVIGQRRYLVDEEHWPWFGTRDEREPDIVVSKPQLNDSMTHPLSERTVSPVSDEDEVRRVTSKGGSGVDIVLEKRRVEVSERILGYRRRKVSEPAAQPDPDRFGTPLERPPLETTATVIGFSNLSEPESQKETLHCLAHAIRVVLPQFVRHRDQDLGIAVLQTCSWMEDKPALVLYDNVPMGIGVDEQAKLRLKDDILPACYDLLVSCPCSSGCAACTGNPTCKAGIPPEALNKAEAIHLLGRILGRVERAQKDVDRLTNPLSEDDLGYLALKADELNKKIFGEMLGLQIGAMPDVLLVESLPDGIAGFYTASDNTIRLRPMPVRETVGALTHELAHAWEHQPGGFSDALLGADWLFEGRLFLEGFAQWVEVKALDYLGFEAEVSAISGWSPDEYGVGFRLFNHLEEDEKLGGAAGVCRFVREPDIDWLRGTYMKSAEYRTDIARLRTIVEKKGEPEPDFEFSEEAEEHEEIADSNEGVTHDEISDGPTENVDDKIDEVTGPNEGDGDDLTPTGSSPSPSGEPEAELGETGHSGSTNSTNAADVTDGPPQPSKRRKRKRRRKRQRD